MRFQEAGAYFCKQFRRGDKLWDFEDFSLRKAKIIVKSGLIVCRGCPAAAFGYVLRG
jgi:hypothetical protein